MAAEAAKTRSRTEQCTEKSLTAAVEEVFGEKNIKEKEINLFFGLPTDSLSKEQLDFFRKFSHWAGRKMLVATLNSPILRKTVKNPTLKDAVKFLKRIPLHELSHCIVAVAQTGDPLPEFLIVENQVNNEQLLRDELHALLFWGQLDLPPLLVTLLDKKKTMQWYQRYWAVLFLTERTEGFGRLQKKMRKLDHSSFEQVFSLYQETLSHQLREVVVAEKAGEFSAVGKFFVSMFTSFPKTRAAFQAMAQKVHATPDKEYKDRARRIFEQYASNKYVLFDEFKTVVEPAMKSEGIV